MEDSSKKAHVDGGDKEIIYSRTIKAGKRIYYLDVKKNLKDDLFLAITESKKVQMKDSTNITFEKHKIFLYKEDFDKFSEGLSDVIHFIKEHNSEKADSAASDNEDGIDEIKLDINF